MRNKVRRMPYSRTHKREEQLEIEEAEKELKRGRRLDMLKFLGVMTGLTLLVSVVFYGLAIVSYNLTVVIFNHLTR